MNIICMNPYTQTLNYDRLVNSEFLILELEPKNNSHIPK